MSKRDIVINTQPILRFTDIYEDGSFTDNEELDNYDLTRIVPLVTYSDWCVGLYRNRDLIYIDEEVVKDVEVISVIPTEELEEVFHNTEHDRALVLKLVDADVMGETDDGKNYVCFKFL